MPDGPNENVVRRDGSNEREHEAFESRNVAGDEEF